jgi:Arc/MetJ-type ribon-helix-helix transcriptional regulator
MVAAVMHDAGVGRPPGKQPPTRQLAFRLPLDLIEELTAEMARIAPPGIIVSRSDVVRVLLREALEVRRKKAPKKK